jgi:hypothetical protein
MMTLRSLLLPLIGAAMLSGACGGDRTAAGGGAGLATRFDSTGDTVRALVEGVVDSAAVRSLVAEVAIAGEVGDTVLFGTAGDLTLGPSGDLVVRDYSSTQLLLFGRDGRLIARMGGKGSGPGEYGDVGGIVARRDSTWAVYDASAARVTFFGADGALRTSWMVPSSRFFGSGMLTSDSSGALRIAQFIIPSSGDFIGARVAFARIVDGGGVLRDTVVAPTLGVKQPEYRAEGVVSGGRMSTMSGSELAPGEISSWHPHGHWVLMEGGGYRLLFARRDGKPMVVTRVAPSTAVDDDERAWHEEDILWSMRRVNPAWTWQGEPIPKTRAPARSMFVARDGAIWVQVALPSERIPEVEREAQRPEAAPVRRWRDRSAYEVFGADGTFRGRVALPARTTLHTADGDVVWGTRLDADDVPTVVRFRVTPAFGG